MRLDLIPGPSPKAEKGEIPRECFVTIVIENASCLASILFLSREEDRGDRSRRQKIKKARLIGE
jgi:hypothetical protein